VSESSSLSIGGNPLNFKGGGANIININGGFDPTKIKKREG